ncbi:MAG: hypothetical protein EA403_01125 [Spirochaetaceae bacterium]|nr:MAG: hypothetical protein EA403_01125 [Spirochaetaceae bacterium]
MTLATSPLVAYEPEWVDAIVTSEAIARRDAAYMSVVSAGLMEPERGTEDAIRLVLSLAEGTRFQQRMLDANPHDPVTLGEFAFMLMLSHEVPGGVWYRLFPGPRYSVRELRARRIILEPGLPSHVVDGDRAFRIVTRLVAMEGEI